MELGRLEVRPGTSGPCAEAGAKSGTLRTSDAAGRVRLCPDRAGWWLVRATAIAKASKPDLDWESRFTTLTLSVRAAPARGR